MTKQKELPLVEPIYKTYQYQGPSTAIIGASPSIRNWYLNHVMNLRCNRLFLHGITTPDLRIPESSWRDNPFLEKCPIPTRFTKGYINPIIREMIDSGYYVYFLGIDDYYVQGKSWYKEKHFFHDGLICGYDQREKTYTLYAYDSNWICRKFSTPQASFNRGRIAGLKKGVPLEICGIKAVSANVEFSPQAVLEGIRSYLDSNLEKYPFDGEGDVDGIVVHEYIAEYLLKLFYGSVPYERMDRRIFRLLWEHKKVMLERICLLESTLKLGHSHSKQYKKLVEEADKMRILYAVHHSRRRDSVLPILQTKLSALSKEERNILTSLIKTIEKEL